MDTRYGKTLRGQQGGKAEALKPPKQLKHLFAIYNLTFQYIYKSNSTMDKYAVAAEDVDSVNRRNLTVAKQSLLNKLNITDTDLDAMHPAQRETILKNVCIISSIIKKTNN